MNRHRRNGKPRGGQRRSSFQPKDNSQAIASFIQQSQHKTTPNLPAESVVSRVFADYALDPQLQANLRQLGFDQPTPIQEASIDSILAGNDLLGIANTGTGKTGAFLIPAVHRLLQDRSQCLLVVAPTRELAIQIESVFRDLSRSTGLRSVNCIGGSNIRSQIQQLSRTHHAIIGTPGRMLDLIQRGHLSLDTCHTVVLDEVDRMLDMGFVHDIKKILSRTPSQKQSLYFSATMNPRVSDLIAEFSRQVQKVSVQQAGATDTVEQVVVRYDDENNKFRTLQELLNSQDVSKTVVFGRTKHGVKKLAYRLQDHGFRAESIHGNKSQNQRRKALADFRDSHVTVLVATDVAARGIDVDDVSHVINYDLPETVDDYIHRVGRTGRAGKKGVAYTLMQ